MIRKLIQDERDAVVSGIKVMKERNLRLTANGVEIDWEACDFAIVAAYDCILAKLA
jgi:hypothetical protein